MSTTGMCHDKCLYINETEDTKNHKSEGWIKMLQNVTLLFLQWKHFKILDNFLPRMTVMELSSTSPCVMVSVSRPTQDPSRLCMSGRILLAAVVLIIVCRSLCLVCRVRGKWNCKQKTVLDYKLMLLTQSEKALTSERDRLLVSSAYCVSL